MIFTPRSCPSSPGFATSTRIFFSAILRCALCVFVTSVFRFRSFADSQDISPYSFFQDWGVEIDEEAKPTVSRERHVSVVASWMGARAQPLGVVPLPTRHVVRGAHVMATSS